MSDSEMLLFTKERPRAIRSRSFLEKSESAIRLKKQVNCTFALSLTKNKRFAWKTDGRIWNWNPSLYLADNINISWKGAFMYCEFFI